MDLTNIVRSFVTKDAKNYTRPVKQLRSVGVQVVGVQVNPIDVKLEVYEFRDAFLKSQTIVHFSYNHRKTPIYKHIRV